jgi:hypothetical protein
MQTHPTVSPEPAPTGEVEFDCRQLNENALAISVKNDPSDDPIQA